MSVLFIEGFETDTLDVGDGGNQTNMTTTTAGPWSAYALQGGISGAGYHLRGLRNRLATTIYGAFRFQPDAGSPATEVMSFYGAGGGRHARINLTSTLLPTVSNSAGTVVATSAVPIYSGAFNLIEFNLIIGDSTTFKLRLHGQSTDIISVSSDFKNGTDTTLDHIAIDFNGQAAIWDDIILYDNNGSQWNSWVGDKGVVGLYPNAAGDTTQWTPSAGSNYATVDEAPPSDSDYVSTDTTNNIDLYNIASIPAAFAMSGPLVIKTRAKKNDPGTRTLTTVYKTSGATQVGSAQGLPTGAFVYINEYLDVDATDSAVFDDTKVASLQIGPKATI